jgi:hypothetical protein
MRRLFSRWRYADPTGNARDLRLDLLRGWCIFSMVVDHAAGDTRQTFLFHFTGNGGYPITGAHGFVLISGVVMGVFYLPLVINEGIGSVFRRALERAFKLYLVAIVLGLMYYAFGFTGWGGGARLSDFSLEPVVAILLLHSGADDLMVFYLAMVLVAPVCFYLFQRGKTWAVVGASLGIWLAHLFFPNQVRNPADMFAPIADWQVFFITGLVVGYHRRPLQRWLIGWRRRVYLLLLLTAFAALLIIQVGVVNGPLSLEVGSYDFGWVVSDIYADYDHNPPLHVAAVLVWLFSLYHLVDYAWAPIRRLVGWFLIPLGQAALYVYAVHQVLVYLFLLNVSSFNRLQGIALAVAEMGLMLTLWAMVKKRFLFGIVPR